MIHLYTKDILCHSGHQTLKLRSKILVRLEHIQLKNQENRILLIKNIYIYIKMGTIMYMTSTP